MKIMTSTKQGGKIMERTNHEQLKEDYDVCEEIIRKHSKSFYFAFSNLPKDKARAIYGIYAFCRTADDSIDEAGSKEEQAAALDQLKNELEQFERGEIIEKPVWRVLKDVFSRYDMSIKPFYDQLKGQEMDHHFTAPSTLEELENYSYHVAGSVGLMLLPILATRTKKDLTRAAIDLGVAMQLTNILRDVGEDYHEIKRIYLPGNFLEKENYQKEDFEKNVVSPAFIRIWETIAKRAEFLYAEFQQSVPDFDRDSQFSVLLSANVYGGILNAVRKNNYDCFTKRSKVSLINRQKLYQLTKKQFASFE